MGPLYFCLPALLKIHRNHKQKEFLKSCEGLLKQSNISSQISTWMELDGAWDIFWIKSLRSTYLALQKKSFSPKKFQIPCSDQKVPFRQFFRKGRDGRTLIVQPSRFPHRISKVLFILGADLSLERLKTEGPFFKVQSGKKQCDFLSS